MNLLVLKTLAAITALFIFSFGAYAITLDEARSTNQVSELPTGYIKANNDKVKALVDEVNAKRRKAYEEIAKKNGLTVDQVAAQAAKKIESNIKK